MSSTSVAGQGMRVFPDLPSKFPVQPVAAISARHGWIALGLAALISACIPLAIIQINWVDSAGTLWPMAACALLLGAYLGTYQRTKVRYFVAGLVAGWLGLYVSIGNVLPGAGRIWHDLVELVQWGVSRGASEGTAGNPAIRMLGTSTKSFFTFGGQLIQWWKLGGFGEPAIDNRIFLFLITVVAWLVLLYFSWALYSGTSPIISLLPAGAVLVSFVVLGGQGEDTVNLFLLGSLFLIMRLHVNNLEKGWNTRRWDYPSSVGVEVIGTGVVFMAVVGVLALYLPQLPQNPLAMRFWQIFNDPWSALETNVGEAFTGVRHNVGGNGGNDLSLGGGLNFADAQVVFYAVTNEPPPPSESDHELETTGYVEPEHYFAGASFSSYDAGNWHPGKIRAVSRTGVPIGDDGTPDYLGTGSASETEQSLAANQPLLGAPPPIGEPITQQIVNVSGSTVLVFAYSEPLSINQPVKVRSIGGYPTRINLANVTNNYTVTSIIPSPTANALRASSDQYPAWISPYLQKPNEPSRVTQLAQQWVAGANNPYDKAMNIETELRKLPYTTNIQAPPPGQDPVDYFLFDLKRGYCEYYASAEVVLLREVGVPARLVTGYATNVYNTQHSGWEITQNDAHTWVQVYYSGAGWVDMEPTPVNPEIVRPEADLSSNNQLVVAPPKDALKPPVFQLPFDPRIAIGALAAILIGLTGWIMRRQWIAELTDSDFVRYSYKLMVRRSRRFGFKPRHDETPLEYGSRLARCFELASEPVNLAVKQLTGLYVLAQYAGSPLGLAERNGAGDAWRTVRFQLWRVRRTLHS